MTAYAIALSKIKDPAKMQEYAAKAGPLVAEFGGEVTLKGKVKGALTGDSSSDVLAVMKFPSMDVLEAWYASDAYQATIPVRSEAAEISILKVAG